MVIKHHSHIKKVGSLTLVAYWQPISYGISYDLNGGLAMNPTTYTIQDHIRFNQANKSGFKFIGWYLKEEAEDMSHDNNVKNATNLVYRPEALGTYVEEIKPNTG